MEEYFNAMKEVSLVLCGGFCSLIVMIIKERYSRKYERNKLFVEKLEKAYSLAQDIYDGYKGEMQNIKSYNPKNPNSYHQNRIHPGKSVNHLKMILRGYLSNKATILEELNKAHRPLKKIINDFEANTTSIIYDDENRKNIIQNSDEYLDQCKHSVNPVLFCNKESIGH